MDTTLLHLLNPLVEGPTRPLWAALAHPAAGAALGLVLLGWLGWNRRWRLLVLLGLSAALADAGTARMLKPVFDRARPCAVETVALVAPCGAGASMPSAHAANTAALAAAGASPPLVVVAGLVGVSRVVTGQHWPSDVLVGWLFGALVGGVMRAAARRWFGVAPPGPSAPAQGTGPR